ncbi:uncharacterized protein [Miscanthus floridulus]|uniref:uncharacterized protein n=1 Tax=Miscanthus floridulus TaxID=154761 RepID=UPI00345B1B2E
MGSAVRAPCVAALHPIAPSLRWPAVAPPHHGARCVAPDVGAASHAAPGVGAARCAGQGGSMVRTSPAACPMGPAQGVAAGGGAGCRTAEVRVVPAASSGMALWVTAPTTRCCFLERRSFPGGGKPFPFPGGGESFPRPQQLQWQRCGPPRGDGAATLCRRCPRRRLALQSSVREISRRPPRAEGVHAVRKASTRPSCVQRQATAIPVRCNLEEREGKRICPLSCWCSLRDLASHAQMPKPLMCMCLMRFR